MKKISLPVFLISIVGTIILCVVVLLNWHNITELFSSSSDVLTGQLLDADIGDVVFLTGQITTQGDYVTHTHTLTTDMYGAIGLKSSTRNLWSYNGIVGVTGTVADLFNNLYILQVSDIVMIATWDALSGENDTISSTWLFLPMIGLYLKPSFFQAYDYGSINAWNLTIVDRTTSKQFILSSFGCIVGSADKDCPKLASVFAWLSLQKYVGDEGVTLYRQSEAQSWYAHTEYFGYFYNDWTDDTVLDVQKHVDYINNRWVQNNLVQLCVSDDNKMQRVSTISIDYSDTLAEATITGSGKEWSTIVCNVVVDPTIDTRGSLKSIQKTDATTSVVSSWSSTSVPVVTPQANIVNSDDIPDVAQFPLKPEKGLIYKTTRWHSITFPSPNISYASSMVDTDLWFAGTKCTIQINVVAYPQKDLLQTQPAIQLYECRRVADTLKGWFVRYTYEDIYFVVRVIDPAWFDFARWLVIAPSV